MKKKVILNSIFLFSLIFACSIHIFCLIPQSYPAALVPALMLFPFIYIAFHAYLSTKHLFLTRDDISQCPRLKLLDRGISVFNTLFWCLIAVWFIARRG